MGGRGANYEIVERLKNYSKATIRNSKISNYLLNPDKDKNKADFFKSLGYNMKNDKRLIQEIKNKLKTNKALYYGKDEYGNEVYQVNMQLGITKKVIVATGWIIQPNKQNPEFVTAYNNKKLNKERRG